MRRAEAINSTKSVHLKILFVLPRRLLPFPRIKHPFLLAVAEKACISTFSPIEQKGTFLGGIAIMESRMDITNGTRGGLDMNLRIWALFFPAEIEKIC